MKHIIVVHGMRHGNLNNDLKSFVTHMLKDFEFPFEIAFLESVDESVENVVESHIKAGVKHFKIQPLLLLSASHYIEDLPKLMEYFQSKYNEVTFEYGDVIGTHPKMLSFIHSRIEASNSDAIVVIAHGNKRFTKADEELKAITAQVNHKNVYAAMIYGALDFKKVLPKISKKHNKITVVPMFLYDGYLVNKIKSVTGELSLNATIEFTPAINFDPVLKEIIQSRFETISLYRG